MTFQSDVNVPLTKIDLFSMLFPPVFLSEFLKTGFYCAQAVSYGNVNNATT